MIEMLTGFPDNVVALVGRGKVTGDDYERVLVPAIEEKLKKHKKVRVLYHLGADFSGYTAAAMWDDAKVGLRHLTAFEKIAVVTDTHWITDAVKVFGYFIPCPVRIYGNSQLAEAKTWVSE